MYVKFQYVFFNANLLKNYHGFFMYIEVNREHPRRRPHRW